MLLSYYAARANLYQLWQLHPEWDHAALAAALGSSKGWVKKWLQRFRDEQAAGVALTDILSGHSRARKHPPVQTSPVVVEQVQAIRDQPPEGLRRVPGQQAIRYYLERDGALLFSQLPVPSAKTIYRILKAHDRIPERKRRRHQPLERPAPLTCWQIDFKDVSSVPADPEGKRQHVVETLNIIDMGTSVLLDAHVRADFTAETALEALAQTLSTYGRPNLITLDRDTRWVGSPAGSDFPAALIRFCACLGIEVQVCAPQHPQENGFVERYNLTYQTECLAVDRPRDLVQAQEATQAFVEHYNVERPHQGLACGNRPPRTAFPTLPTLPPLPSTIDPDSWLQSLDGLHLERKIDANGMLSVDLKRYYVSRALAGHRVSVQLDAQDCCLHVFLQERRVKALPLRGLLGQVLSFEQFLAHMLQQARAQHRLRTWQERRWRSSPFRTP